MTRVLQLTFASFLGLAIASPLSGSFVVSSWSLSSRVHDLHDDVIDSHSFNQVVLPFVDSHSVTVPLSTALASYNFVSDDLSASFHTNTAHQALDVLPSGLFSRSSAFITIQSTQDLLVSVMGSYAVGLPPDEFMARLQAGIRDNQTSQLLWGQDPSVNSFGGNFVSTTLHVDSPLGGVLVPANGHVYTLSYTFLLQTFGGGTNAIGTGNGEIQWNIQVVPEPSTLKLLCLIGPVLLRRSRRVR